MTVLDWTLLCAYLVAMLAVGFWLGRRQQAGEDYYVGGHRLGAGAVGISVLATQSSAISFISIPAFVALRPDGGLRFLQYELPLPLAMAVLCLWVVPALRHARVISIYALLERRFDPRVRRAVAAMFLLGRGLSTGVALYATGLVLTACLGTPLVVNLLLVGVLTTVYDLCGGITAVVYSDVAQMVLLTAALALSVGLLVADAGGLTATLDAFPSERRAAFAAPTTGHDSLLAYLLGGVFLYASYYGCDQSQAQRLLATPSVRDSQRALLLNGLLRFPLIAGYCALGVAGYAALASDPGLHAQVTAGPSDAFVPMLLRDTLPAGVRGLVFAGLLAAAMSSLDSALNALSASTVQDFMAPARDPRRALTRARGTTLAWGAVITAFSFFVGDISETVIEAINKVGSAVYGPVLAMFLLAVAPLSISPRGALAGLATGFATNLVLWLTVPDLHFLWWNPIGCLLSAVVAVGASRGAATNAPPEKASVAPSDNGRVHAEPTDREPPLSWHLVVPAMTLTTGGIATAMWLASR